MGTRYISFSPFLRGFDNLLCFFCWPSCFFILWGSFYFLCFSNVQFWLCIFMLLSLFFIILVSSVFIKHFPMIDEKSSKKLKLKQSHYLRNQRSKNRTYKSTLHGKTNIDQTLLCPSRPMESSLVISSASIHSISPAITIARNAVHFDASLVHSGTFMRRICVYLLSLLQPVCFVLTLLYELLNVIYTRQQANLMQDQFVNHLFQISYDPITHAAMRWV